MSSTLTTVRATAKKTTQQQQHRIPPSTNTCQITLGINNPRVNPPLFKFSSLSLQIITNTVILKTLVARVVPRLLFPAISDTKASKSPSSINIKGLMGSTSSPFQTPLTKTLQSSASSRSRTWVQSRSCRGPVMNTVRTTRILRGNLQREQQQVLTSGLPAELEKQAYQTSTKR